jgi:phage-related protein
MPDEAEDAPKIQLRFYRTSAGHEPVRGWLMALDRELRLAIGEDLLRVQYRWPVGMPLCRPLGRGLWEVRTSLPNGTVSRVLICFHRGVLVALSGFIKKTQKTPRDELDLALRRKKEVENGE